MNKTDEDFAHRAFTNNFSGHYRAVVPLRTLSVVVRADVDDGKVMTVDSWVFLRLVVRASSGTRVGILGEFEAAGLPAPDLDKLVAEGVLRIVPANDQDGPWYEVKT